MSVYSACRRVSEAEKVFKPASQKELRKRRGYNERNTVYITVRGGVAEVEYAPPGIFVDIRDYDNEEAE